MSEQHSGVAHWKWQRVSSVLLVPFTGWLIWAVIKLSGAPYEQAAGFFAQPLQALLAVLFTAMVAYHAQTGIQVVCEDYVPQPLQSILIVLTRIACTAGTLAVAWAVFTIGGAGS